MKKSYVIFGIIGVIVLFLSIAVGSVFSARKTAINLEERVKAQHVSNKSTYDNMWKSFKEITQVTELQTEQFKEVYMGLIQGRYEDNNLLFKMIQEDNPEMDTKIYIRLAEEISAGRKTFNNAQEKLVDIIREYNSYIRPRSFMCSIFNFKELDANDFIVTSERTNNAFETNEDDVIKLKD